MLGRHRALLVASVALSTLACANVLAPRQLTAVNGLSPVVAVPPSPAAGPASFSPVGRAPSLPRDALSPYLDFMRQKRAELSRPGLSERDRHIGQRALLAMQAWLSGKDGRTLTATEPLHVYERCWLEASASERRDAERARSRDAKLEEYWRWALRQWGEASVRFYRAGAAHLITQPPQREASLDALTRAVLDWAITHADDPAFLERSPSEVALYLLARQSTLATFVELGTIANPHHDYTPDLDPTRYTLEQLATELLVSFIPGVGNVALAIEVTLGITITGHQLEAEHRLLLAFGVLIPFAASVLFRGGERLPVAIGRTALITGHSLHEAHVLARVASHLSPSDVAEIERMLRGVAAGRRLTPEGLTRLNRIAHGLEIPLARLGELVRQGGKTPLLGSRLATDGAPLAVGSAEHLAQCWVDYQFRYPQRYRRFTYEVDPAWEKLYRSIIQNSASGGEFEKAVLGAQRYRKNTLPMMPPPESNMQGFIPDAVKRNPSELVWGKPYQFVEAKGRQEMALTGNLEAMIEYVKKYGGYIEVWFRSPKHPSGRTSLSKPLESELLFLRNRGSAAVKYHP